MASQIRRHALAARLASTFDLVGELQSNAELQAHFARYLCILVSGYVEQSVREVYSGYAADKSSPRVARVVDRFLNGMQNPSAEALLQIAAAFDPTWRSELEAFIEGPRRAALDSIVANRNQIAHGESVGITFIRVRDWYNEIPSIIEFIEGMCSGSEAP